MPPTDEGALIHRMKEGSHEAFRELVQRHMKQAYDLAYGFAHDHDDAEDIAQEAFVRVYHSIHSFRREAGFKTWLYRIVTNVSLDRLKQKRRKSRRQVEIDHPATAELTVQLNDMQQVDLTMHIERALHELPTLQRAVIILRHMDGLSTKQVSHILRCSEGTVKTHLHRGLKKMRQLLEYVKED